MCGRNAWSHVEYDQLTVRAGEKPARTGVKTLMAVSDCVSTPDSSDLILSVAV